MDVREVAERFVDLVLKYRGQWCENICLSAEEVQIFFDLVSVAGFEPKEVSRGVLVGHYRDIDGSATGRTFPINSHCPFKVTGEDNQPDSFATGWLDCAVRHLISSRAHVSYHERQIVYAFIAKEIERSVPLKPIPLTLDGDLLCEYPPSTHSWGLQYFVDHTRDEDLLGSCVGVHKYCRGWMDRCRATDTKDRIVCRKCGLKVLFPKEARTYGDLRHALVRATN